MGGLELRDGGKGRALVGRGEGQAALGTPVEGPADVHEQRADGHDDGGTPHDDEEAASNLGRGDLAVPEVLGQEVGADGQGDAAGDGHAGREGVPVATVAVPDRGRQVVEAVAGALGSRAERLANGTVAAHGALGAADEELLDERDEDGQEDHEAEDPVHGG